ncbi:MAG: metallophosphoesterase family protein [Planctomycetaceae bacterium]
MHLAFFGGIYNNSLALDAAIRDARRRGAEQLFCLGDIGAFGPHPDRVFPLLREAGVQCVQGNYDDSVGNDLEDCQCGYTDPRDNHFAQISYDYTYQNTSGENRRWMRSLPKELRFEIDGIRFLLCHGSPRKVNEFLWESTTSTHFLEKLARDYEADVILGTHTGLHWERRLGGGKRFVNAGVLGRPENDGTTNVWYTLVNTGGSRVQGPGSSELPDRVTRTDQRDGRGDPRATLDHALRSKGRATPSYSVDFIPLEYEHERLAAEMREEQLPEPFIETILTGWWTTCLEVLPSRERRRGRY